MISFSPQNIQHFKRNSNQKLFFEERKLIFLCCPCKIFHMTYKTHFGVFPAPGNGSQKDRNCKRDRKILSSTGHTKNGIWDSRFVIKQQNFENTHFNQKIMFDLFLHVGKFWRALGSKEWFSVFRMRASRA